MLRRPRGGSRSRQWTPPGWPRSMMLRKEREPAVISSRLTPQYDAAGEPERAVISSRLARSMMLQGSRSRPWTSPDWPAV